MSDPSDLTRTEIEMLIQSMEYTVRAFDNYAHYPSYQFRVKRIKEAEDLRYKLRQLKKGATNGDTPTS